MSLENRIYGTLTTSVTLVALVGTKIYPQHRPQRDGRPALVYSRAGGQREYTLNNGYVSLEHPRVMIEVFASAIDDRRVIGDAVITAMEASTRFSAIADTSPIDFYDPSVEEYKRIIDFSIWNHE